jgi:hypothetical protein
MYSKRLFIILTLILGTHGCSLFSGENRDGEAVFAPTEVGMPEGPNVTKNIGPAGGTLASPDGRLTVTVPQNALTETLPFSIQPITNKAGNGLGLAYRLEPDGKTFTTPLDISVKYDEKDLEGTIPEALSLAYQDKQGAWHMQKSAKLDQAAKTLTIATTHFTDFAVSPRLRILPRDATVYVGGELQIQVMLCPLDEERAFWDWFWDHALHRPLRCDQILERGSWTLRGPGRLDTERYPHGVSYQAPARKPTPNIAYVAVTASVMLRNPTTGETILEEKSFTTIITILDYGYRASGHTADVTYSGVICSLEDRFTVTGTSSLTSYPFKFVPDSGTSGKVSFNAAVTAIKMEGGGSYTIEGADTDNPRIAMTMGSVGHTQLGSPSGGGKVYIDLEPLRHKSAECD